MEWFLANRAEVFSLAGQHLVLAILPMVFGVLIAIPLAQLARQNRGLRSTVLTGSSLLYTIPSLALFVALPGIIGTGLLAVPVLAGSAAYGVAEWRGWAFGLENKPWKAKGFYGVITAATLIGLSVDYVGIDPIKALFWSAVINGVIAVPIMVAMMIVVMP